MPPKLRSRLLALARLLRPNRSLMVAAVAGTGAVIAGAGAQRSLLVALTGWLLAVGGFSLDLYADRALDTAGPRSLLRRNPLAGGSVAPAATAIPGSRGTSSASGSAEASPDLRLAPAATAIPGSRGTSPSMAPAAGLAFSLSFLAAGLAGTALLAPVALVPAGVIVVIVAGLALHWFDGPLGRAFTLGALQALYLMLGAAAGGAAGLRAMFSPAILLLAGMFFFAMFGGRGMIDIRDFPVDAPVPVRTLPKWLGVRTTAVLTALWLHVAFALSLAAYWTGRFNVLYIYLALPYTAVGLLCAWWFALHPSPGLARRLTLVFMIGEGALICLAAILGSLPAF